MLEFLRSVWSLPQVYADVAIGVFRYVLPILSLIILYRCGRPLLTFRREPEIWAWLCMGDGKRFPVHHWECVIGRSKRSDIVLPYKSVPRNHAVLTRYDDGSWTISAIGKKSPVLVNGNRISIREITPDDVITVGNIKVALEPVSKEQEAKLSRLRGQDGGFKTACVTLLFLTILQLCLCLSFLLTCRYEDVISIFVGFLGIFIVQWCLLLFYGVIHRNSFELETIAFFLCTLGMAVLCAVKPAEVSKQLAAFVLGVVAFLIVGWSLRDLERAKLLRRLAAVAGVALLVLTLVFGTEYYGAKNWLVIGGVSLQPSELSKVCFVFAGASTMDRIMSKRNIFLFIVYSAMVCICLAMMNDFGTALIFFVAFLIIAYMRSGSVGTIALAIASVVFAGVLVLKIAPHALRRFENWRHIWESAYDGGYQQTRAIICLVSGGMLGLGTGQGWLKNLFAADTDIVFAVLAENWGYILAVISVCFVLVPAFFVLRSVKVGRSSFYSIAGATAAGILLMQTILNVLGTVDVLFLTGVTFPFVSNGGSSMIAAWGLLACIKSVDTRQNASFTIKQPRQGGKTHA